MQIGASIDSLWGLWNEIYDYMDPVENLSRERMEIYSKVWDLIGDKYKYDEFEWDTSKEYDNEELILTFFKSLDKITLNKLYFDLKKIQDKYNGRK